MNAKYITPSVTLFREDGHVDPEAQSEFCDRLVNAGMDGILILGSIGEFFAIPADQKKELAQAAIEAVNGRTQCIVGTASMVPDEIVPFSNFCLKQGANAVMIISPYYFALDQESIFRFYDRLLDRIYGAVYIYNFPDRTGYSIAPETFARLACKHDNLQGVKDTLVEAAHTRDIIGAMKEKFPQFEVFCGFDDNAAHTVLAGGAGVIGGLSNVVPEVCSGWVRAMRENDLEGIAEGQEKINRLMKIYSIGPMFVSVIKEAAKMRGLVRSSRCTFPIPDVTEEQRGKIKALLESEGLL